MLTLLDEMIERVRSSKPTASAHLMSQPLVFQFGRKHHARHGCPIMMPILKPELVSEKACRSVIGSGPGIGLETTGDWRTAVHHLRSWAVSRGQVCGTKGRELKPESMNSRLVRYACPAGTTSDAWSNFPYSLWTSTSVCLGCFSHSLMVLRYFIFLLSGIATV